MSKVKCAAGLDSLNVREMANVPEIDIKLKDVKQRKKVWITKQ